MKIVRFNQIKFEPASHEDPTDPGVLKKVMLRVNDLASGQVQMVNWAKLLPGKSFRKHSHETMEEVFIMVEGRAQVCVGQKQTTVCPGDVLVVPAGYEHELINSTNHDVIYIVIGIVTQKMVKGSF